MVIEEALIKYLLTQTGLIALISNRIYLMGLPQSPEFPAIVLQKISAPRLHGFTADYGVETRIQISIWALSYTTISNIFEQLRASLQNYINQTMGGVGGVDVKNVELDDEMDIYEDDTLRFGRHVDFIFWHTEV